MLRRTFEPLETRAQLPTVPGLGGILAAARRQLASLAGSYRSSIRVNRVSGRAWGDRRLLATVYADVVGYSRLFGLDDTGTVARIRALHGELIVPIARQHYGQLVSTAGDAMLMVFDSITEAVLCAVAVQRQLSLHDQDRPADRRIRLRIGVDIGDVIFDGEDLHGDGVIVAARLQSICPPGGVCVSRAVHDRGSDRLGLKFDELGPLTLKNLARQVEAFVLRFDQDRTVPSVPKIAGPAHIGMGTIRHRSASPKVVGGLGTCVRSQERTHP
jgi:class 3 adenylate cyclase